MCIGKQSIVYLQGTSGLALQLLVVEKIGFSLANQSPAKSILDFKKRSAGGSSFTANHTGHRETSEDRNIATHLCSW